MASRQYLIKDNQVFLRQGAVATTPAAQADVLKVDYQYSDIGFLIQQWSYYSGGRYYDYMVSLALSMAGYKITRYTNLDYNSLSKDLSFYSSFDTPVLVSDLMNIDLPNVNTLMSANHSALQAINIAARYNKNLVLLLYDPPEWLFSTDHVKKNKYEVREVNASWEIKKELELKIDKIRNVKCITLTEQAIEPFKQWYNFPQIEWASLTPPVNLPVASMFVKSNRKKENIFCTINRNDYRKNLVETLECFKPYSDNYQLYIITNESTAILEHCDKIELPRDRIVIKERISDYEKFDILSKSKLMICNSMFEGFGMWSLEAMASKVPLVCYDLPSLANINYEGIHKVPLNRKDLFEEKLKELVENIDGLTVDDTKCDVSIDAASVKLKNIIGEIQQPKMDKFCFTGKDCPTSITLRDYDTSPVVYHFNSIYRNDVYKTRHLNHMTWGKVLNYTKTLKPQRVPHNIRIITFSNYKNKTVFEEYCDHLTIPYTVLGKNILGSDAKFDFVKKIKTIKEQISEFTEDYYLILDANDLVIAGDINRFLDWDFKDSHVLFGAEEGFHPESPELEELHSEMAPEYTPFKFLNAGMIFGNKENILNVYSLALEASPYETTNLVIKDCDQMRFNTVYLENPDLVKLDHYGHLFYCNDPLTLAEARLKFGYE